MQSIFLALAIYTTNMLLDMEIAGKFAWVILFWTVIGSWNAIERSSQNQTFLGLRKVSLVKAENLVLWIFCSSEPPRTPEKPEDIIISCIVWQVSHITTLSHLMRKISLTCSTYNLGFLKTAAPPPSAHQMVYMPSFNLDIVVSPWALPGIFSYPRPVCNLLVNILPIQN